MSRHLSSLSTKKKNDIFEGSSKEFVEAMCSDIYRDHLTNLEDEPENKEVQKRVKWWERFCQNAGIKLIPYFDSK